MLFFIKLISVGAFIALMLILRMIIGDRHKTGVI